MRSLAPKLQKLAKPMQEANKAAESIARAAGGESTARPVQVVKTEVNDPYKSLTATPMALASVLAVVLLAFFFAPYVGPLIGMVVMLVMGFATYDTAMQALLPAAIYLGLHPVEGQIVTPIVLGRRMALSPLVLILVLMVFGWLWDIVDLLLAVPLLVCAKMVLTGIEGMDGWAKLLE